VSKIEFVSPSERRRSPAARTACPRCARIPQRMGWLTLAALLAAAATIRADELKGVVVDQTSAPLPGVTLEVFEGSSPNATTTALADGTFVLAACPPEGRVTASLAGFESVTVPCSDAAHIVLPLKVVTETTEVRADVVEDASPSSAAIGSQISGVTIERLPTATQHAREALPLLPSVVRGVDGLLRIDGVRPHEAPLLLDGFNVTDPASGVSSIDPPLESVRSVEVLRDPMAVTFGNALGSMASIETAAGGDTLDAGVQGFVPRPRLSGTGFGTLEGFSPRAHLGGQAGPVRYFVAAEYDFNLIPVPGVTTSSGRPDIREVAGTVFGRADVQLSSTHVLSLEGLLFPSSQELFGLSPLRTESASPTTVNRDNFGGVVDRHAFGANDTLILRLGVLSHRTQVQPNGDGQAEITPDGRSGGSFSSLDQTATRIEGVVSWQRRLKTSAGLHELTVQTSVDNERLGGTVAERSVEIKDVTGALVRMIRFGAPAGISAAANNFALNVRDLWHASDRLQIDAGVRDDWSSLAESAPSARVGFRYAAGQNATTVLKGGVGEFVGSIPLSVPAFAGFPVRFDQEFAAGQGQTAQTGVLRPLVSQLALPRALAANVHLERALAPGWDALLGVSMRKASRLATLDVRAAEGSLLVSSTGQSTYREAEFAVRRTWGEGNQLFVSYTRSSARGEINDFASLFTTGDVEILQPGRTTRLAADAPHRVLAWGTFNLPAGFAVAPAVDWHSGFPYSPVDAQLAYVGAPNGSSFPAFFSLDLVVYKSFTIAHRKVKLNVQLFNATDHFNPRDVFTVVGAPRFGTFTNSVGPTVRGDIAVNW
jgi:hypothetical protein